ncbi:MAG: flagellar hook-associated protein FlgL [Acidobacteriaceae bacterium]|nr:flagellar hook-associated protein FlgL [Acidobacteriaceae bacterium]
MRVTNSVADVQYAMQQSEQLLATALQQVSTSKRVNQLSDDPSASANMVRSLADSAKVDRYTSNGNSVLAKLQVADSALSSVVTSMNQAITLGTSGANSTLTDSNRESIAAQVQGILSSVIAQANTTCQGSYVFAGSDSGTEPFTADATSASGYSYNGNSTVNQVQVGDSISVATNIPGDQVFTDGANVIQSLANLVTALQSGTLADIGTATTAVSTALNYVSQQRVPLGNAVSQLNAQESYLSQETVTLTSQQTALVGADLATAATNLSEAETTHSAVLAAAAKVLPQTLLDYLR